METANVSQTASIRNRLMVNVTMKRKNVPLLNLIISTFLLIVATTVQAESESDLAQELTNPLADLITIPIQMNFDDNIGVNDAGNKITTNIQPVIPIDVNDDWMLITRTIVPVIYQDEIYPGEGSQFGLGDVSSQLFFSPKKPSDSGVIWGVGPVLLLPTATDSLLGSKKWGAGPTGVALTMRGPWTVGGLANHIWSFAGDNNRSDISNTFLQPFAAYTWNNAWTVSVQSESTYNWDTEQWAIPINFSASKLVRFGKLPISLQAGVGYWLESPDSGPEGYRFRLQANFVLPRQLLN